MNTATTIIVIVMVLLRGVFFADSGKDILKKTNDAQTIQKIVEVLEKEGLNGIMLLARQGTLEAPIIRCDFWVSELRKKDTEAAKVELMKRDLGKKIAVALDEETTRVRLLKDNNERAASLSRLLALSDWLKKSGLGNLMLVNRIQGICYMGLAYLIADLDFPFDRIEHLEERMLDQDENMEYTVEMLNYEYPKPFIGKLSGTEDEKQKQMYRASANRLFEVAKWSKENNIPSRNLTIQEEESLPAEMRFYYCENKNYVQAVKKYTTVDLWDTHWFGKYVNNPYGPYQTRREVKAFLTFRKVIGKFPEKPEFDEFVLEAREKAMAEAKAKGEKYKGFEASYKTLQEAAFAWAWEGHGSKYGALYAGAYKVYTDVKSGKYMDEEWRQIELNK